jgi:hypothetical protein
MDKQAETEINKIEDITTNEKEINLFKPKNKLKAKKKLVVINK